MIDEAATPRVGAPPGTDRWRRWWLVAFVLVLVSTSGFLAGRRLEEPTAAAAHPSAASSAPVLETTTAPSPSPAPSAAPSKTTLAPGLLRLSGPVPVQGSATFRYASRRGPVLGAKGPIRRFRVAVENGSGEDVEDFAEQVEATLGDPRSWIGGGTVRLQPVSGADPADFTVYLVTRVTAARMCMRGGTDIRINGVPYTSCRATGKAIINLDRWRLSSKPYLAAGVPLTTYRQYVVNHEVGHELGHRHENCPKAGGPAPVMVQQTLTTRGCVPYAWPRRGSGFLTGPLR
jgi:hypothetical protein